MAIKQGASGFVDVAEVISFDPTVQGYQSPIGSTVMRFVANAAVVYIKSGDAPTAWTSMRTGSDPVPPVTTASTTLGVDGAAISVDVTALGDGEYFFEFEGSVSQAFNQLIAKANGADLTSCHTVEHLDWIGVGVNNIAVTTGVVYDQEVARPTSGDCVVSLRGRFSSRSGKLSGFSSQFNGFQAADAGGFTDKQGYASGFHTPVVTLTAFALAADAGVIRAGSTLRVTRLST